MSKQADIQADTRIRITKRGIEVREQAQALMDEHGYDVAQAAAAIAAGDDDLLGLTAGHLQFLLVLPLDAEDLT